MSSNENDFNTWEEVTEWLRDPDAFNTVTVMRTWSFSEHFMNCGDEYNCCHDQFDDVDETIESVRFYANNDLKNVEKD